MTSAIGRRRLEMIGDRIEAVCAGHKVHARVLCGLVRRGRVVMLVSTGRPYDLRNVQDEIALSLGVPVRVFRDAVTVEVLP